MKSFKEFISETKGSQLLTDLLHGPCNPFFKQSQKNGLLFRGFSGANGFGEKQGILEVDGLAVEYYKKKVRKDRKPMSTTRNVSKLIDDWFEDEMGMRARSEAVFCYGERGRQSAQGYGDLGVVLPIGKFTYCWSPEVHDLYDIIMTKFEQDGQLRARYVGPDGTPDTEAIAQTMSELGYTMNRFDKAVEGSVEIMIDCEEYFVIPCENLTELRQIKKVFVHA